MTWRDDAACTEYDPDYWFTDDPQLRRFAQQICDTCPVLNECRDWVLGEKKHAPINEYGVVAGMTVLERQAARKKRRGD